MKQLIWIFLFLPFLSRSQNIINTIAGSAVSTYSGDGGSALLAGMQNPSGVAYDAAGNLYISDCDHHAIRKVSTTGVITTIAGTGVAGFSGDGGPAVSAQLRRPLKLYIDAADNIFVADFDNNRIRKITAAGIISTVAGNGSPTYSGDGGLATAAGLNEPCAMAFDLAGNMYISDYVNYRIRKVTPAGIISTYAGIGTGGFSGDGGPAAVAQINGTFDLITDNADNLYLADASNNRVRKITPGGIISTIAGTGPATFGGDGGPAIAAQLYNPAGLGMDAAGNLYVADQFNYRIRRITTTGIITTMAGSGINGFSGDGGPALVARISNSNEICISPSGSLVICDDFNNRVREVTITNSCDTIALADTIAACSNATVTLTASIGSTGTLINVDWTPGVALSDSTILAPTVNIGTTSGMRYITTRSTMPSAVNLVINGAFTAGNTGFSSSYTYAPGPSSVLNEGFYSVYTNPYSVHTGFTSFSDHTSGSGNMLIINGAGSPVDLWCQTITVTPNTDYDFSAWFANCSSVTTGAYVPILQFKINGVLIGTPDTVTAAPGVWSNFNSIWNSGASTTATICIYNLVVATTGNDFVIDDITFQPYCTATDSVYLKVLPFDTTIISHDTAICAGTSLSLTAPAGYTTYSWNGGGTTSSISAAAAGAYWVISGTDCARRIDTFHLRLRAIPVVNLGNDTGRCLGGTITLSSTQPSGYTYLWSTGSIASTISPGTTGTYWLTVSDSGCTRADTINLSFSPAPVVNLGPDTANCDGNTILLQSSVAYSTPTYLWNTGNTSPSITAIATGTYWLQVTDLGCSGADTVNVIIVYDTLRLLNRDTAICLGQVVQVFAYANPAATYQWLPTAGIAFPNVIAPTITPDTSAMYYVVVNMTGCPPKIDSFYIDVQPYPQFYLGGSRFVCAFDTVHLTANVAPGWFNGYTYSWSPATSLDNNTGRTVVFTAGATQTYILTVSTSGGCIGIDSAKITVQPSGFANLIPDQNICPRDSLILPATGGVAYHWYPSTGISDATSANPWVYPVASTTYSVVVTSAVGCTDTIVFSVNVWPAAMISLADSLTLYPGDTYHVTPFTNCTSFIWFPYSGVSNPLVSDPTFSPVFDTRYIVFGTTEHGCKTSDSISIYVSDESFIDVPNAFAPGNGTNNVFSFINRGIVSVNYFRVFNRWGNMMFETKSMNQGWDGAYKGEPQPFGVYVYDIQVVTPTGKIVNKHGNLTLLR